MKDYVRARVAGGSDQVGGLKEVLRQEGCIQEVVSKESIICQ